MEISCFLHFKLHAKVKGECKMGRREYLFYIFNEVEPEQKLSYTSSCQYLVEKIKAFKLNSSISNFCLGEFQAQNFVSRVEFRAKI